jgi:hypothetical protein
MIRAVRTFTAVVVAMASIALPPAAPAVRAAIAGATLSASDVHGLDTFGSAVAVAGDTVVVGAPNHDAGTDINGQEGAVYVYARGASAWSDTTEVAKLTASDAAPGDQLGFAVAVAGDVIAASAIRADGGAGAIYVFVKPADGWVSTTETAKLRGSSGDYIDLGWSLATDGNLIVAGAPSYDIQDHSDIGAMLLFEQPAAGWGSGEVPEQTESMFIGSPTSESDGRFGLDVAVSGRTIVAGAPGEALFAGAAYVYQADLTIGWSTTTRIARLSASDGDWNDAFGTSVAVRGRLVAVGAPCDDDNDGTPCVGLGGTQSFGSVYVFQEPSSGWATTTELARLHAASPSNFEMVGSSLAIDDDGVFAGAPGQRRAYRFVRPSAGWANGTEASILTDTSSHFGQALDAAGSTLAVGSDGGLGGLVRVLVIDEAAPTTSVSIDPEAADGSADWYVSAPHLNVAATDHDGSGVANVRCILDPGVAPTAYTDLPSGCPFAGTGGVVNVDGSHTLFAASIDAAGNASDPVSMSFAVDHLAPTTTVALDPSAPDGDNGWYRTSVTATVSAADGSGSGVGEVRCALDPVAPPAAYAELPSGCAYTGTGHLIAGDGAHVLRAASRDVAGNAGALSSRPIQIDGTAPSITCRAATFVLGQTRAAVTAGVSDATSGPVATDAGTDAQTSTVGARSATLSGLDVAGNRADVACPYLVQYDLIGPTGLKDSYQRGSVITVRIGLATASGVLLSDAAAKVISAACGVRVSLPGEAAVCARYDATADQFVAPLKTTKKAAVGATAITVEALAGQQIVNSEVVPVSIR